MKTKPCFLVDAQVARQRNSLSEGALLMKKFFILLIVLMLLGLFLVACRHAPSATSDDTIRVVCTSFAPYDWIREIVGDKHTNVSIHYLNEKGLDMHNYMPSAKDIISIHESDFFIYVGGESENWVSDVLKNANHSSQIVLNMMAFLEEDLKMNEESPHSHDEDHHEDEHAHAEEYDEHVWLSIQNAKRYCAEIVSILCSLDASNAEYYQANGTSYLNKLNALDAQYLEMVEQAPHKTLLFGDQFPFRYLVEDYHLEHYAVFSGCSADSEVSFDTIIYHAKKLDELGLQAVCVIENSDQKVAKAIIQNTQSKNQIIHILNSMQRVSGTSDKNFLDIMTDNLHILKKAMQ